MKKDPNLRIYLIRHGETENSARVCFNGHHDVPLSPQGKDQIRQVAQSLKTVTLDAVYSSDLIRARESAEIISGFQDNLQPVPCKQLREISFGAWEGLSVEEVQRRYPGQFDKKFRDIATFQVEGGETFQDVRDRVLPKFDEIRKAHSRGQVALVVHGGVIRIILAQILSIPLQNLFRISQDYAAVNIIQYYGNDPVVELMGGAFPKFSSALPPDKKIAIQ
ncbi:MAG: alpha-ribazole phosphatase [Nitrospinae bacterium CG11_big_fil_rev_8_21_14_0_20_56_8]|nr:MAG: alpha-ribazole phosphatase [Nitrospinae bacterium CG11_big_fil_rev_8_21_14_0_20_56_8]